MDAKEELSSTYDYYYDRMYLPAYSSFVSLSTGTVLSMRNAVYREVWHGFVQGDTWQFYISCW